MKISRRKNTRPAKNATMAATKNKATGTDASKLAKAARNRVAITVQTSKAVTVQSVMARPISWARRESAASSACRCVAASGGLAASCASRARPRSMMRERRLVSTASMAPMPERRNTGATASWIAWATAVMPGDCCTTRLRFTPRESWLQRSPRLLERPGKVADVVERLARQGLGHVARRHGSPDHDEPRVVIFHRQATVVLRALDLAYILTFEHGAARDGLGIREHVGLTLLRLPHIDDYGGMIVREDFAQSFRLDLRDTPERAPHGDPQLVAPDFGIARGQQLRGQALALAAVGTVAVEHERRVPVLAHQSIDLGDVRDVHRHRHTELGGHGEHAGILAGRAL